MSRWQNQVTFSLTDAIWNFMYVHGMHTLYFIILLEDKHNDSLPNRKNALLAYHREAITYMFCFQVMDHQPLRFILAIFKFITDVIFKRVFWYTRIQKMFVQYSILLYGLKWRLYVFMSVWYVFLNQVKRISSVNARTKNTGTDKICPFLR